MLLDLYAFQYGDDGFMLNSDSIGLPFVDITSVSGLDNAPIRSTTQDREGLDGGYVDAEFETIRTVVLGGNLYAEPATMETILNRLKGEYGPSKVGKPFYFRTPDMGTVMLGAKPGGLKYDWDTKRRTGVAEVQFTVLAEDPTIYGTDEQEIVKGLAPSTFSGRGYDRSFDYGYGGQSNSSAVLITNRGNKPSKAILTIHGDISSGFSIVNDNDLDNTGTPRKLEFDITLTASDYLTVDLRKKTVVLNGTTSRRAVMTADSRWWLFQPGPNNIRFLGASTSGAATLTIQTQSAWR